LYKKENFFDKMKAIRAYRARFTDKCITILNSKNEEVWKYALSDDDVLKKYLNFEMD
jgi:hypothetical protein